MFPADCFGRACFVDQSATHSSFVRVLRDGKISASILFDPGVLPIHDLLHADLAITMHRRCSFLALAVSGLLLATLTACDYTAPEGGMMNVRLYSTSSDVALDSAGITLEHVSIASGYNESNPEHFGDWPNMLDENKDVDLTEYRASEDTLLLKRHQVQPGDFDGLHVQISNTAEIKYQNESGDEVRKTVQLSDQTHGNLALEFDRMLLKSQSEEATLYLQFDLDSSFQQKDGGGTLQYQPSVTLDKLVVNGDERALSGQ